MTPGSVIIHLVHPGSISKETALDFLSDDERLRAARFRFENDAIHWIKCRASLRKILGDAIQLEPQDVPLVFSEFGKPALARPYQSPHFNLSHCPGLAVVALCPDGPVGIDLEALDRASDLLECETTFCHPVEIHDLPDDKIERSRQLLRIWTAKEAVLKALGTGLSHPPERTRILFQQPAVIAISDLPLDGIDDQQLHELFHPTLILHQAFVSLPDSVRDIVFI